MGFWFVTLTSEVTQRWLIDYSGYAEVEGTYPEPPENLLISVGIKSSRLDGDGNLIQLAAAPGFEDSIIRRTIDGLSETVYLEADIFLVKMHASGLTTGP